MHLLVHYLVAMVYFTLSLRLQYVRSATYTLIAPQKAVRGQNFEAILYTYQIPISDLTVDVNVTDNDGSIVDSFVLYPAWGDATSISFDIGQEWQPGYYQLSFAAADGSFSESAVFTLIEKSHSVFIQTDKATYKPSQTVLFRVIVTSADLKPFDTTVTVTIQDSDGHRIMQWTDETLTLGFASFELPLSDQPPLGTWLIQATAENQISTMAFEVAEYTLPRFQVTVKLPGYITVNQREIRGSVSAQYTYGEKVMGMAIITFSLDGTSILKTFVINGAANFVLSSDDIEALGVGSAAKSLLVAMASVSETLTGFTLSGSSSVAVSESDVQLSFLPMTSDYYKRGLNYTAYLQVSHPDGSLLGDSNLQLSLSGYYTQLVVVPFKIGNRFVNRYETRQMTFFNEAVNIPEYGIAAVEMSMPAALAYSVSLTASFTYENATVVAQKSVTAFQVLGDNNIGISLVGSSQELQSGDSVSFNVVMLQRSIDYFCIAIARGRIVSHVTLAGSSSTFTVQLTPQHAPQTTFVVYAFAANTNEIIADAVTINVAGAFTNQVDIFFQDNGGNTTSEAQPGDNVTLQVRSSPNSLVALLSVDQSVLLLKGGNDITQDKVLQELNSFKSDPNAPDGNPWPLLFNFFWPRWAGSSSSQIFSDAGLNILSDASIASFVPGYPRNPNVPLAVPDPIHAASPTVSPSSTETTPFNTRSYFPETWIWSQLSLDDTGAGSLQQTVPGTITSWVTTAFSMNAVTGLAVTASASKFRAFQNFFLSAVLPYSVVYGEEVALKLVVFNYMDTQQNVRITLLMSDSFAARKDVANSTSAPQTLTKLISVPSGGGSSVNFWIVPLVLGNVKIIASAVSPNGGDQIENDLLVHPEGMQQSYCLSDLAFVKLGASYAHTFMLQYPANIVAGSRRIEARVSGDIMGPSIQGLDQLVQVPYGCGEQNMIAVCPSIFVREYLEAVGLLGEDLLLKTQRYMLLGYQRELTYWRSDGLFSAFGNDDTEGSTWLTAFVIKSFRQAKPYLSNSIDDNVFDSAQNKILQERQDDNGAFFENGRIIHVDMQGSSGTGEALTAYVLIALLEDNAAQSDVLYATQKTVLLLERSLANISKNAYKLAIVTYSLVLANSSYASAALSLLEKQAISTGGTLHWSMSGDPACLYCPTPSGASDVEMTAYALLTYVRRGDLVKATQVAKWLVGQRSSLGGFTSTQDTVLGLQSLAKYAQMFPASENHLTVTFTGDNSEAIPQILVSNTNSLLLQSAVVQHPNTLNSLTFTAVGHGSAIVSACVSYYTLTMPAKPIVDISVTVTPAKYSSSSTKVRACGKKTVYGRAGIGMAILQVTLASGFSVDTSTISATNVRRIENFQNQVSLYFDEFTSSWTCVTIPMRRAFKVNSVKEAFVTGYLYYNPDQGKTVAYNPVTGAVRTAASV